MNKTRVCHWCGYTNHDGTNRVFSNIDGIDGHGECWNLVKTVLMHAGLATKETQMGSLIQIMRHVNSRKHTGEETVILFRDGSIIMNATNEDAKQVEEGTWCYLGDLVGIAEKFEGPFQSKEDNDA